ncbi:MAG TPA: 7-carboxy-7-deazaguanine synthase QueE [Chitinophagales bacterium]|nr:7-carboxy-7-deazaguanine synthase QueE [Chitinophagales bacterium]
MKPTETYLPIMPDALVASLPVMEQFYTIQGEGYHQGNAAVFIRLGGCDVGCVWCDVKDSWNAAAHPLIPIEQIITDAAKYPAPICVITGGEPLMHNLTHLTQALQTLGKKTHLETSGAHPLSGNWDWICLSPKKFKFPLPEVVAAAHELKVVIYHKSDFEWAEMYAAQTSPHCRLFLQPEWGKSDAVLPLIVAYVKKYPQWRISLQTHKYMNIP